VGEGFFLVDGVGEARREPKILGLVRLIFFRVFSGGRCFRCFSCCLCFWIFLWVRYVVVVVVFVVVM